MPFISKRTWPIVPAPVEGGTSEFKINRGMLQAGVLLSVLYSLTVTVAGAAVRAYSMPIRRVSLITSDGKTLQSWKAADLVALSTIVEQQPLATLLTAASAAGIAVYNNLVAHIPLMFNQFGSAKGDYTALPTFGYQELTLRVEWGDETDCLTGAPTGSIAFTANGATVTQLDYADLSFKNPRAAVSKFGVAVNRWKEIAVTAGTTSYDIDLGTTADIRALLITAEDANGEATMTVLNTVGLKENKATDVYSAVPFVSLRADNAKHFGVAMPAGRGIIDFAEDGDVFQIYRARQKSEVLLQVTTLGVPGTVRVGIMTIEPPKVLA